MYVLEGTDVPGRLFPDIMAQAAFLTLVNLHQGFGVHLLRQVQSSFVYLLISLHVSQSLTGLRLA